jgi:hypothetical protein
MSSPGTSRQWGVAWPAATSLGLPELLFWCVGRELARAAWRLTVLIMLR